MIVSRYPRLRKWFKRIAFVLATLVTLVALAYAIESYRGRRVWRDYRAELEAKGEVFDFRRLVPAPVPDDQNFFMTPLLRPFSDYVVDPTSKTARLRDPEASERVTRLFAWTERLRRTNAGWPMGQFTDLAACQQQLRATNRGANDPAFSTEALRKYGLPTNAFDVARVRPEGFDATLSALQALAARPVGKPSEDLLFLLGQNRAELEEIREAARRPAANFAMPYEDMGLLLPQLAVTKALARPLAYSALAHLAQGDSASAARDLQAVLRVGDALAGQPLLIVGLVRMAISDLAMQPLWEGLARHQWNEPQLSELEGALKRINAVEEMRRCLRGERAFSIGLMGGGTSPEGAMRGVEVEDPAARAYASLPAPLKYQSQVAIARLFQEHLLPAFDPAAGTVDLARLDEQAIVSRLGARNPYTVLVRLLVAPMCAAARNAAKAQATVNLARVAVALERHRLAQGALPEQLAELAPRFLDRVPPDPVSGQPLVYRRGEGDRFTLYAVGMNGRDDGGAVALTRSQAVASKAPVGDWVWQNYPVTNTVAVSSGSGGE